MLCPALSASNVVIITMISRRQSVAQPTEQELEFLGLRARYEVLMEMPIETEFEVAQWVTQLDALIADIKRSSYRTCEVMHP